jgi:hypothetical protein
MGWLDQIQREYKYQCKNGHESLYPHPPETTDEVIRQNMTCPECKEDAEYAGFLPIQVGGGVLKETYEQNGRKAYRIKSRSGKVMHISKSKYDYLETGKIKNCYTPEHEERLVKAGETDFLEPDDHKRRARAGKARLNAIKKELGV